MPPDNCSLKSLLWPAGKELAPCDWQGQKEWSHFCFWIVNRSHGISVEDETVTLTTRSKGLKHDKCDYNIQESHLGRQGKRQSQQDIKLFITLERVGTFKAKQLTAISRKVYSQIFQHHQLHYRVTIKQFYVNGMPPNSTLSKPYLFDVGRLSWQSVMTLTDCVRHRGN